jgi:hypothetical protein
MWSENMAMVQSVRITQGCESRENLRPPKKNSIVARVAARGFELAIGITVDPKELGAQLRLLREGLGVSGADLAERMDWKPTNVSRLERGGDKREPTISSVNLYVRMLGFELVLVSRPKRGRARGGGQDAGSAEGDAG